MAWVAFPRDDDVTHSEDNLQLLLLVAAAREVVEADDDLLEADVTVNVGVESAEQVLGVLCHVAVCNESVTDTDGALASFKC